MFSNLPFTLNVNSLGSLVTNFPAVWALPAVLLKSLVTLYLLFTKSTLVINICSLPIWIISPDLSLPVSVDSPNLISVVIPVTVVAPIATWTEVLIVLTPTGLNPSMFL